MEFFMAVGMGLFSHTPAPKITDFIVVISGDVCTPCKALMPLVDPVTDLTAQPQLSAAWSGQASFFNSIFTQPAAALQTCMHCCSQPQSIDRCICCPHTMRGQRLFIHLFADDARRCRVVPALMK